MTTILLARHGETNWNREGRFQGHSDTPLNERGREQARELAAQLRPVDLAAIYSSDLRRAHETAAIVGESRGLTVEMRAALREIDVGSWSGFTHGEIEASYPEAYARWRESFLGWEGGETYDLLTVRVREALVAIAGAHPDETVLAVTHGGAIRAMLTYVDSAGSAERRPTPAVLANCGVSTIAVEDEIWRRLD